MPCAAVLRAPCGSCQSGDSAWWLHHDHHPTLHLPCLLVDPSASPPFFFFFFLSFFSFLFFSRFPDSGLKMKRKSYCLITTAVTSIKCYLKVNGLHMLKTLELLTDHCKVSRIFNNLHGTHSPAMFSAGQAASPAWLPAPGSEQKPLLHSSLKCQNGTGEVKFGSESSPA